MSFAPIELAVQSSHLKQKSAMRTLPPFAHAAIADAAFTRRRSTLIAATKRKSPNRSFAGEDLADTETVLPLLC